VVYEEVYMHGNKAFYNNLKVKLANNNIERINCKSRPMTLQPNLYSMMMFTNENNALHFEKDDAKLLVVRAPNEPMKENGHKHRIYKELNEAVDNGAILPHIYHYLLNRDVSEFSYGELPVRTDAYFEMCDESKPDYQRAIIEMCESNQFPFNSRCLTFSSLRMALKNQGYTKFGDNGLSDALTECGWTKVVGQKKINKSSKKVTFWIDNQDLEEYDNGDGTLNASGLYHFWDVNKP
jgi:hypothetical protein